MAICNVLVVPDVHVPFHDRRAWDLALRVIDGVKPDCVVSLGDLGDFYATNAHGKSYGREQRFAQELAAVQAAVRELVSASGRARRIWLQGNHEENLERYVAKNAPQLEDLVPHGPDLLKIPPKDTWIPYRSSVQIGKTTYVHGLSAGQGAALKNLACAGENVVTGHTHRAGLAWGGTTNGDRHFSMECGWLGDREQITYMQQIQMRNWAQGLGLVQMDNKTGHCWPSFIPFVKRHAIVLGKQY
jgi:metallophosphoesterase superfamily enzyme